MPCLAKLEWLVCRETALMINILNPFLVRYRQRNDKLRAFAFITCHFQRSPVAFGHNVVRQRQS